MKTLVDRFREMPREYLEKMISRQKNQIKTAQRELECMEEILKEKDDESTPATVR